MTKYLQLNDKDWLYQKYIVEKISLKQLGDMLGCKNCNTVRQALKRFSIPIRDKRESKDVLKENDEPILLDLDIFNGSMLGDGMMRKFNKTSQVSNPYFAKKNMYIDHVEFIAKSFYPLTYKEYISLDYSKLTDKYYPIFRTLSSKIFLDHYNKWYPDGGIKVVPNDLILTPNIILHWFMDDGCSYDRKRKDCIIQETRQVCILFASQSFNKEDNQRLVDQLRNFKLNAALKYTTGKDKGTGYTITISQGSANDFFDLIGPCPVKSLEYKWKYRA